MWSLPSRFLDFPVALRSGEVKVSRCAEHQVFNWPTIALSGGFVCSGRGIRNADTRQCPLVLTLGTFGAPPSSPALRLSLSLRGTQAAYVRRGA